MKSKGLVLSVEKNTVTVLTPDGEFRRLPRRGAVRVGEEYTYSTTNRLVVAAASVVILIASSPLVASFFRPAPSVEGPGDKPVLEEPIVAHTEREQNEAGQEPGKVTPQRPEEGDTGQVEPPAGQDDKQEQLDVTKPEKPKQAAPDNKPVNKPPAKQNNTAPPPAEKPQEEAKTPGGQEENPPAEEEPAGQNEGETNEEVPEAPVIVPAENEPVFQEASRRSPWEWLLNLFVPDNKQKQ